MSEGEAVATRRKSKVGGSDDAKGHLTQEQVDGLLDNLYEIYAKLDALAPVEMSKAENDAWTLQYTAVTDAIRALRNQQIASINAGLDASASRLAAAIDDAENELHGVQDKAKILTVVGNVAETIATFAALV